MSLTLIAALARNHCIGQKGAIPWYLPEDLKHFKELTNGHVVIMGRKTWESLPERFRPLPNRTNIVLTRQEDYPLPAGVKRYTTLKDALAAHTQKTLFVIGGAEIYAQALPLADRLELTHVDQDIPGDTFFPEIDQNAWKETAREPHDGFVFATYERLH